MRQINRRRWANFRANRRGYVSVWIFAVLVVASLFAEFIANDAFRAHYEGFARSYRANLGMAHERGQVRAGDYDVWSWAIIGLNVFLGMRFAAWDDDESPERIAGSALDLLARGMEPGR